MVHGFWMGDAHSLHFTLATGGERMLVESTISTKYFGHKSICVGCLLWCLPCLDLIQVG